MTYEIDRDIPPPIKTAGGKLSEERRAIRQLRPGESVLFSADVIKRAQACADAEQRESGKQWTYTSRKQPDGSTRIWRLT